MLASGLFAEETFLAEKNPIDGVTSGKKKHREEIDLIAVESTEQSARPGKKRRESYIPMPARRQSVVGVKTVNSSDRLELPKQIASIVPGKPSTRRMSMGAGSFPSAKTASTVYPSVTEGNKLTLNHVDQAAPVRPHRRTRLSIAGGMQENADPQTLTPAAPTGYFFKGLKMIAQSFKSASADCPENKPIAAVKSKPLQQLDGKSLVERTSNRRKSVAPSSKPDLWKDL